MNWQYVRNGCAEKIVHENKYVLIPGSSWLSDGTVELSDVPEFDGQLEFDGFILINGSGYYLPWFRKKCQLG